MNSEAMAVLWDRREPSKNGCGVDKTVSMGMRRNDTSAIWNQLWEKWRKKLIIRVELKSAVDKNRKVNPFSILCKNDTSKVSCQRIKQVLMEDNRMWFQSSFRACKGIEKMFLAKLLMMWLVGRGGVTSTFSSTPTLCRQEDDYGRLFTEATCWVRHTT